MTAPGDVVLSAEERALVARGRCPWFVLDDYCAARAERQSPRGFCGLHERVFQGYLEVIDDSLH